MKLNAAEQAVIDRIRDANVKGLTATGVPCPDHRTGKMSREDARTFKLMNLGLIHYVGVGKRTEHGHEGGRGLVLNEYFDANMHTIIALVGVPNAVRKYPFNGITVRQAIELFPDLLDETLVAGESDSEHLDSVSSITFQFNGDGNYRTKKLNRSNR